MSLLWIAGGAGVCALAYTVGAQAAARAGGAVRRGPAVMRVALTFDDGPHPECTPRFLQTLARYGVRATFFLIGQHAEEAPDVARAIGQAGHDVGSHTYRHRHLWRLGPRATREEIARGRRAVERTAGVDPRYFRPPWGTFNAAALRACRAEGLIPVLWTVRGEGYRWRPAASEMAREVVRRCHPGAIVNLHDRGGFPDTPERVLGALPEIIAGLRARGLEPVTLSDLLASECSGRESGVEHPG
ncbi:MAG: polysaccharide deacetylase family protein [Armatimonadota bacterium]|nr:polysaccharide deacetylase family protein [Armatimonadota bacterium]MDR5696203.1 polysaccharide deacetylase family protein [Armatimonadota bacterium]